MDEHPGRGLVDGLGSRHKSDTGADESFVNLHIISTVPGEPVELMNDAELHPRRRDERQHLLKAVAVG